MKKLLLSGVMFLGLVAAARADNTPGQAVTKINPAVAIVTGNTFQALMAAQPAGVGVSFPPRLGLTVENNNATGNCFMYLGSGTATKGQSILLLPGAIYTRYFPFVPTDAIQVTCDTAGMTVYADTN